MEAELQFAGAVWIGASIFALIAAWQFVFVPSMLAWFRQDVFTLRRQLFLLVVDGKVQPTHHAYVRLRSTMNGLLNAAERVTFVHVMLTYVAIRGVKLPAVRIEDEIASCPDCDTRRRLEKINARLGFRFALHAVLVSPVGLCLAPLLACPIVAFAVHRRVSPKAVPDRLGRRAEPFAEIVSADECDVPAAA